MPHYYIVMPPTSKKLKGQIGLGLFVCPSIYPNLNEIFVVLISVSNFPVSISFLINIGKEMSLAGFRIHYPILPYLRGWSGGAMVLGKLPVPGRPTISRAYGTCVRCGLRLFGHVITTNISSC